MTMRAATRVNAEQASKPIMRKPARLFSGEGLPRVGKRATQAKRARRRKPDTAKVDLEPPRRNCGGQGAHREVGSEGFAEQYRTVVEGQPSW